MSELPKGWIAVKIGDVLQPQSDGKLIHQGWSPRCHTEAADTDDWGVLKTTAIQDGLFLEEHNKKLPEDKEPRERIEVHSGDLLMTNAGPRARCGITTFVKDVRPKLMLSGKMYRMRFNEKYIYPRFIEACLRSDKVRDEIDNRKTGMSESGLNLTQARFLTVPFLLAPYNEQIRIANKLDSILAKVDKAQARLDKIPAILKRFRQSVLAAATSGELTKEWREENTPIKHSEVTGKYELDWSIVEESVLPESWQWVPLGNYAKCNRGKFSIRPRNDPSCFGGEYPFIQIGDLPRQGGFIYSHKQTLNEKGYSVSREFDTGTVVMAIVGATIANTGITTYPVCFPDSLVGINSASETTNKYLDYHLRAIKEDIRQASYAGGGQPNIKLTMVNPLPLPLPSEAEIVEIVEKVESLMAKANKVEKQYLDAKARLDRLTQSILAKAFRGELVPQDPNDEPAEKLLERILAEKELSKPKKATRKRATKAKTSEKE